MIKKILASTLLTPSSISSISPETNSYSFADDSTSFPFFFALNSRVIKYLLFFPL